MTKRISAILCVCIFLNLINIVSASTSELTIFFDQIEYAVEKNGFIEVVYWESESARYPRKFTVSLNANVYFNDYPSSKNLVNALNDLYGTVTFSISDTEAYTDYDTVHIEHYENSVVESVDMTLGKVVVKEGRTIVFGETGMGISSTLYDENGNKIDDWSVLKENDILSNRISTTGSGTKIIKSTLVRNTVSGIITEIRSSDNDEFEFLINNIYYKIDTRIMYPFGLILNDKGVFYLDMFGRIVYYESEQLVRSNYSYVVGSEIVGNIDPRLEMKMFSYEGEMIEMLTASRVKLVQGTYSKFYGVGYYPLSGLLQMIYSNRVITYSVDSTGDINIIELPVNMDNSTLNYFTRYAKTDRAYFDGSSKELTIIGKQGVTISDNTIIMVAPQVPQNLGDLNEDSYAIIPLSALVDDDIWYDVSVYVVNQNQEAGLIVVGEPIEQLKTEINFCVTADFASANTLYYNKSDKDIAPVFVIAQYNDEILVNLEFECPPINANSYGFLKCIMPDKLENGNISKAFLLDSWDNAMPLSNTVNETVRGNSNKDDQNRLIFTNVDSVQLENNIVSIFESSNNTGTVNLSTDATIYVNGTLNNDFDLSELYGDIEFNNFNGNTYNEVYINNYTNTVVASVDMKKGRVNAKQGIPIVFNDRNNKCLGLLYDKQGNKLDWSTLVENDILSTKVIKKNNVTTYISILSSNNLTGTVEYNGDEITIDGITCKTDKNSELANSLKNNDEGIFYLDIFGRIVYCYLLTPFRSNYAYIVETETYGLNPVIEFMLLKADGEMDVLSTASSVELVEGEATTTYFSSTFDELSSKVGKNMVITYGLNYSGKINKIALPVTSDSNANYFTKYAGPGKSDYIENTKTLTVSGKNFVKLSDSTVIMIANSQADSWGYNEEDYTVVPLSFLSNHYDILEVSVYDVDENQVAGLIVIGDPNSCDFTEYSIAIVSRISTAKDSNGDTIERLTIFQNGESKTVDVGVSYSGNIDPFSFIIPRLNANGRIAGAYNIAKTNSGILEIGNNFDDSKYTIGEVTAKNGNRLTIDYDNICIIPTSANVYLYDHNANRIDKKVTSQFDINIFDISDGEYFDELGNLLDKPVKVLICWNEGKIRDVIICFGVH